MGDGRVYAEGSSVHDPHSDAFDLHGAFGTFTDKSESKKIKARTTASHRRRAEQGIPVGGSRPFGWSADRRTLDPQEAPEARRIVAEYLQGRTLYGIAMGLRERGVLTTLGNPWTPDALRKYLANPRLCGWRMLRGEIVRDPGGEPVVGRWEPLVSPEDWQAVHARITNTKRTTPANTTRKYLLSGLLRCGKCGVLLRAMPTKGGDVAGKLLYTCPSKAMGGCGGVGRNAEVLERFVTQAALAHAEQVQAQHVAEGEWGREGENAAAVDRRASLTSAWAAGRMPDEAYFIALEAVENVLKDLRADGEAWASRKATSDAMAGDIRRERENRADQLDWRRGFLADQLSAVVVLPVGGGRRLFRV